MSWGTYYKYDGYLSRIGKRDLDEKYQECKDLNDMSWNQILAMCAMTPPTYAKSEEGIEYPWAEYLDMKLREFREEIEDNARLMAWIDDRKEALDENPENVTEG
jgi:hypothetical protein